jgi:hypothetical protein
MRTGIIVPVLVFSILVAILAPPIPSLKAASTPTFLVNKSWGGLRNDTGSAVATDPSGNMYVVGTTSSFGPRSPTSSAAVVLKYGPDGALLWQRIWSNSTDEGRGIAVDSLGNVFVTGLTSQNPSSSTPYFGFLFKLDSAGNLLWQKVWGAGYYTRGNAVAVDSSNNAYVAGITDSKNIIGNDVTMMKFDSNGNLIWQHNWGLALQDALGIAVDSSGNVYVSGWTTGFEAAGGNGFQLFLLKISPLGSLLWERVYGGARDEIGWGVAVDKAGNVYVTGMSRSAGIGGSFDLLLLRFDSTGALLAQRTWGGSGVDVGAGIGVDASGNIMVTGYTSSYGTMGTCPPPRWQGSPTCYDALLLRVNPSLGVDYTLVYGVVGKDDQGSGVALDSAGNAVMVGSVGGAPPYTVSSGNSSLGTVSLGVGPNGNSTLSNLSFTLRSPPNGMLQTPSGSESYAGARDVLLIKYGTNVPPSTPPIPLATMYMGLLVAVILALLVILLWRRRRKTLTSVEPLQPQVPSFNQN